MRDEKINDCEGNGHHADGDLPRWIATCGGAIRNDVPHAAVLLC